MRLAYDPQTDALSLILADREVQTSREVATGLIVSFDAQGEAVAVDLLGVSRRLGRDNLAQIAIDLRRL